MPITNGIELIIPDDAWEEAGRDDGPDRLLAIAYINNRPFHVSAIEVTYRDHLQTSPQWESELDGMFAIDEDGPFETMEIRGRTYVVHILPFKD